MKTTEFNENFEIDRKSRGVKATAKHAPAPEMPKTADGTPYDAETLYHFFDESARVVRASNGLRLIGDYLCGFGLKIVAVADLHTSRDAALSAAQAFFNAEIEKLRERIRECETEKQPRNRSLKAVLTSR